MELYDTYKPSLYPGLYGIEAKQTINAGTEIRVFNYNSLNPEHHLPTDDPPIALQTFTVVAPQFQLDPKAVNSFYPPEGHVDEGRVLPHIVFNDPHLPWEREPSRFPLFSSETTQILSPWIALVVFDPEEVKLQPADEAKLAIPDPKMSSGAGAYSMSVGDYLSTIKSRVNYGASPDYINIETKLLSSTDPCTIIFPRKELIKQVFGRPASLRYMTHVRRVDTEGFPDAEIEEDKGLYSICVSSRSGPTKAPGAGKPRAPTMQTVHLVSLEGLLGPRGLLMPFKDPENSSDRVGLVSLFSWSYLCAPPPPNNFVNVMKRLADNRQLLMPPARILEAAAVSLPSASASQAKATKNLHDRLAQGYTIARWRTAAGDETAAFIRGPLVPIKASPTPATAPDWPTFSNTGKDYQILDKSTGLMDITYSSAWQLGKLLAISDTVFSSALTRFRSIIHQNASSHFQILVNRITPVRSLLNTSPQIFGHMRRLTNSSMIPVRTGLPAQSKVLSNLSDNDSAPAFQDSIAREVRILSGIQTSANAPSASPEFELIRNWILDKLLLIGIPAHYLITDPSHLASVTVDMSPTDPITLQPEALRFFYIDDSWFDCFIDGALSVANHFDPIRDTVRREIKQVINQYFLSDLPNSTIKPPVPRYGFILRSSIVKVTPDLRVIINRRELSANKFKSPLVRLTRADDQTILGLLDCMPEEINKIIFAQPPHQQRFVAPIDPAPGVYYEPKQLYTSGAPMDRIWPVVPDNRVAGVADPYAWYSFETRCLDIELIVRELGMILPFDEDGSKFDPAVAAIGSSVVSLELNDRNYQLQIDPPSSSAGSIGSTPRQLWMGSQQTLPPIAPPQPPIITPIVPSTIPAGQFPPSIATSQRVDLERAPIMQGPRIDVGIQGGPSILIPSSPSQYTFRIYPSDRITPPNPFVDAIATPPRKVFSKSDYLPTTSSRLVDLVFSFRRNIPPTNSALITTITVVIPMDGIGPQAPGLPVEEPILSSPYTGLGVKMIRNKRLIPSLTVAPGQLQINLTPRSANPGEVKGLESSSVEDISFVLRGCNISKIINPIQLEVMGGGQNGLPGMVQGLSVAKAYVIEKCIRPNMAEYTNAKEIIDVVKSPKE